MIGPGTPNDPTQVIDVRDLAAFIVHAIEQNLAGAYNAISPAGKFTIGDVLDACHTVAQADTEVMWVESDFLTSQGVQAWQHMPAWIPTSMEGYAGFGTTDCSKAMQAGLTIRPMEETARATLDYYRTRAKELEEERGEEFAEQWRRQVRGGLDPEREKEVLAAWRDHLGM